MAVKKIRGYFAFLLVLFASITFCAWGISFGIWSSYSRSQSKLEKHRLAEAFQKEAQVLPAKKLDDSFWTQFNILSEIDLSVWKHGVNDFAGQVSYPLPAIMSISENVKIRWEVMPLLAEGIGHAIDVRLIDKNFACPSVSKEPFLLWFNNGQSLPLSISKCGEVENNFVTDPTQSIKLSGMLEAQFVPILISQGKKAIRLHYAKTAKEDEIFSWYRHICLPEGNAPLLADILGWYIQATALNQDSLNNVEWGKPPVEVTNFLPFA
ncbi:hypothetical protein FAI40_00815 [Acetobacteraceae bacterium]|nr:hypothetical protein FAI40_00815 [Acetobacteraceae bacterium]